MLAESGVRAVAYTRQLTGRESDGVEWRTFQPTRSADEPTGSARIGDWIIVAPVWVIPEHFELLTCSGARRVIALSSTSRFTKAHSSDPDERSIAAKLVEGEATLEKWGGEHGLEWIILRPTLIYGGGRDKNIATAARFIRRFGFFPLVGRASGLRQPVHAADVARACLRALEARHLAQRSYNISGADTITYRQMIAEVFRVMGRRPLFVQMPSAVVRAAMAVLRLLPPFRHLTSAIGERMGQDLVFDNQSAVSDLGISPRPYCLSVLDLPPLRR
jgi:nucleoside-diphosphate-sugar epimerase